MADASDPVNGLCCNMCHFGQQHNARLVLCRTAFEVQTGLRMTRAPRPAITGYYVGNIVQVLPARKVAVEVHDKGQHAEAVGCIIGYNGSICKALHYALVPTTRLHLRAIRSCARNLA